MPTPEKTLATRWLAQQSGTCRLATRWLDRQSGVLEAPPAMVAQIGEWVQATTAATAAAGSHG